MLKNVQRLKLFSFVAITLFAAILLSTILLSPNAHAASKCGGEDTAIIQCANNENGVWGMLLLVINVMSAGVGVLAVAGIVYASILWTTAEDKADQITKAKGVLTNTITGIVAFALMWSGLQFLVPGGVFDRDVDFSSVDSSKKALPGTEGNAPNLATTDKATKETKEPAKSEKVCYTATKLTGKKIEGKMYHKDDTQSYAFENSPQGIAYASNHGYTSIDIDTQVTKDGIVVATHWSKPMVYDGFYDPQKKLNANRTVKSMTYDEVSRLRNKNGESKIISLERMIKLAAKNNINLSIEIKTPIAIKKYIPEIAEQLNTAGVKAYIKGHISLAGMDKTLSQARDAGFWTRGTENSQGWIKPNKCKST